MTTQSVDHKPDLVRDNLDGELNLRSLLKETWQEVERYLSIPANASPTLPELALSKIPIASWPLASLVVGIVFYILFLISAYLDGFAATALIQDEIWWQSLIPPLVLIYALLIIPIMRRQVNRTVGAFYPLVPYNDRFRRMEQEAYSLNRRREWIAIIIGTLAGWVLLRPPWDLSHLSALLYDLIGDFLIFGLVGWHIYAALSRTRLLTQMHGQVQELNIFKEAAPIRPLLLWIGTVLAIIFIGVLMILALIPQKTLFSPTGLFMITGLGVVVTLVLVFSRVPTSLLSQLRVLRAFALFIVVAVVGTIGFNQFEGWALPEAFYATVITMTTIGYGDFSPASFEGRVFTIVLSLFAIGIGGYAVTSIASFVIEGNFHRFIQGKRVDKQIVKMKDHYILCGVGRLGRQIAVEFYKSQVPFVAIDRSPEVLDELLREIEIPYVQGDATQDETLRLARVGRAKGLIAALTDDKDNVFIVLSARSLNPNLRILSRMSLERNRKKLEKAGANTIISPNAVSGRRMVSEMLHSEVVTLLDEMLRAEQQVGQTLRLEELHVNDLKVPVLAERLRLGELTITDIGMRTDLMVVAIKRVERSADDDPYIYTPRGHTKLQRGDVLLVIATPDQRLKLQHDVLEQNNLFDRWFAKVWG